MLRDMREDNAPHEDNAQWRLRRMLEHGLDLGNAGSIAGINALTSCVQVALAPVGVVVTQRDRHSAQHKHLREQREACGIRVEAVDQESERAPLAPVALAHPPHSHVVPQGVEKAQPKPNP
jgi:hypothetical protein